MKEEIRKFLEGIAEKEGFSTDEDILIELLTEGKEVWSGNEEEHRHWIDYKKVVEIEGRFFLFGWAKGGDIFDKGWEFDPSTVIEVKPETKTVTITEYVPI